MIRKRLREVILIILFVLLCVALIPSISWWLKMPLLIILGLVSLLAVLCMGMYYHTLQNSKKSILSYLVIFISAFLTPSIIWFLISTTVMGVPSLMQSGLESSPPLTCSLLSYEVFLHPMAQCVVAIIVSKVVLIKDSLAFHGMNHKKRFKQVAAFIIISSAAQIFEKFWFRPCSVGKVWRIQLYSGIQFVGQKSGNLISYCRISSEVE